MLDSILNLRVAAAGLALVVLAACASAPPQPGSRATSARDLPPVSCVATPTGLVASPRDCAVNGHTWTQDNISRTGAQTTAGALRLLDPTLTVTGH
jgi:hypothetical protein